MKTCLVIILFKFALPKVIFYNADLSQTENQILGRLTGASPELFISNDSFWRDLPSLFIKMPKAKNSNSLANLSNKEIGYTSPNEAATLELEAICTEVMDLAEGDILTHQSELNTMFEDSINSNPASVLKKFQTFKVINRFILAATNYKKTARNIATSISKQYES